MNVNSNLTIKIATDATDALLKNCSSVTGD